MFHIVETELPNLLIIQPRIYSDLRGSFVKTFHAESFRKMGLNFHPVEEFFSISRKNVVRGMHFQLPPRAHNKLVYCVAGRVLDVVVDIRTDSPTYGHHAARELSAENHEMCFIPIGFAHGFLSLEDNSMMVYLADTVHAPDLDTGIHWQSFAFDWPAVKPVLSDWDRKWLPLVEFASPFQHSSCDC